MNSKRKRELKKVLVAKRNQALREFGIPWQPPPYVKPFHRLTNRHTPKDIRVGKVR